MRKLFALLATLVSFSGIDADAQNVSTNSGSGLAATYPDLATAVTALNAATITDPVVITLNANETAPAGGYVITASGTATNTITIQGGGAGRSTVITASAALTAGALNDAIIKLRGADHITIQNLSLQESSNSTITPASNNMTEWGIALLYASATDGASNNTIQNNNIALNRTYTNSFGIYSNTRHTDAAPLTTADITAAGGINSNNKVYNNAISNVNFGIAFIGTATAEFQGIGNDIGGSSAATGNTITNWGGAAQGSAFAGNLASRIYGIYLTNQQNSNVRYNTLSSTSMVATSVSNAILQNFNATPTNATFTNVISNNTVTVTSTGTSTMQAILTQGLGTVTGATVHVNNNIVQNCANAASFTAISNTNDAGIVTINNNIVKGTSIGGTSSAFTGITSTGAVRSSIEVNNNQLGVGTTATDKLVNFTGVNTSAFTGITVTTATTATSHNIKNNSFQGITYTTSGTNSLTFINLTGATAANNVATVEGNTFHNLNVNTTGSVTFMSTSYVVDATGSQLIRNNAITGTFNKGGAGGTVTMHTSGSSSVGGATVTHSGNNFSNITVTGATTITGWASSDGGTVNKTYTNNTFTNWTGGTNAITVMSIGTGGGSGGTGNLISGNTIANISGGAAVTGISITSGTMATVTGNSVSALSSSGAATVTGITVASTASAVHANKIYDLSSSNATGQAIGLAVTSGTGGHTIYNNLIGNLTASASNFSTGVPNQIVGINITGGAGPVNVYYNTVYLTGSGGANFGGSAVQYNATPTSVNLRNNILINKITPSGTGLAVALRRNNGTGAAGPANYASTSNNNLLYAGTPGAANLLYSEYNSTTFATTNNIQTLADYKTFMATRDQQSLSTDVPFQSTTGSSSDFLKYSVGTPVAVESSALPISGISTDFAGTARSATSPDMGAWELAGQGLVPTLSTPSLNPATVQCAATNRDITVEATPNASTSAAITSVRIHYTVGGVTQTPIDMTNTGGNSWTGTIPGSNSAITYYIVATDANGLTATSASGAYQDNPLRGYLPMITPSAPAICVGASVTLTASAPIYLSQGFESSSFPLTNFTTGTITAGSNVTADLNTTYFAQGSGSVRFNTSSNNANVTLTSATMDLSGASSPTLTFSHIAAMEGSLTAFDFGYVEYSSDGGNNWTVFPASSYAGSGTLLGTGGVGFSTRSYSDWMGAFTSSTSLPNNGLWKTETINIPAAAMTNQFRIRFRYNTESSTLYYGWLIDNIAIGTTRPISFYTWNEGTVGNTLTVSPTATTTYSVVGTDANGCSTGAKEVVVTVNPTPDAPTATNSTQCGFGIPTASVTGNGGTFKWYDAATGGNLLQNGGATYTTAISQTTTFYVSETSALGCEGPRAAVTVTVNAPDAVTAVVDNSTVCAGATISLSASQTGTTNTYTYSWTASPVSGSGIATSMSGSPVSVTPTAAGTYVYTVTATDAGASCATTSTVTVTVNPNPVITTATGPATACSDASVALSATAIAPQAGTATVGTANATNLTTTGVPYRTGTTLNNEVRNQWLITPAEMTAAGFSAGNITSISFFVTTASPTGTMSNMVWKLANVPNTVLTTTLLTPSFTTVLTQATYSPVTGMNTHTFSTPFVWDGTSSILVEQCAKLTTSGSGVSVQTTTTSGITTVQASSSTGCTDATGTSAPGRPVMRFGGQVATDISATYTWTWNPGNLTGASVTATAPTNTSGSAVSQAYTVRATNATTGCFSEQTVNVSINSAPTAPTGTNSSQCGTQVPTASVASTSGAANPTFNWYAAATGGTALQSGTATTYANTVSNTTTFYVSETGSNGCESPRTPVTVMITTPDAVTAAVDMNDVCPGTAIQLTATNTGTTNTYNYSWTASPVSGSGIATSVSGSPVSVTPTAPGTYTYTVTATDGSAGCVTTATVNVTVKAVPAITSATGTSPVCSEGNITLSASSVVAQAGMATIGTANASELGTTGVPYRTGNTLNNEIRNQYLITAAELTAAGFGPGNITSISFFVTTAAPTGTMSNMVWKMANVSDAALTTTYLTPSFTTVLTEAAYNPVTGANTHTFTTPFVWDGTSNILVDVCGKLTTTGSGVSLQTTTTGGVITTVHTASSTGCTATTGTAATGRPVIRLGGQLATDITSDYTWTWNPGSLSGASVTATAPANMTGSPFSVAYTVTATGSNGCSSTATVNVTVNPVTAAPVATNSTQCGTQVPTASVSGSGGTYKWYDAASGGTLLQTGGTTYTTAISTTTTFYVSETNSYGCESARAAVTVTVSSPDAITAGASATSNVCPNSMVSLTATNTGTTNTYTYVWTASPVSGSGIPTSIGGQNVNVMPTAAGTYTYTVTGTDAAAGCATTATVSVTVIAPPVITSVTANPTTLCSGSDVTLSAASVVPQAGTVNLGTATTTNTTTSNAGAAYPTYFGNGRQQYLVKASELTALGFRAGDITSLAFDVSALPTTATSLSNYTIKIGQVAASTSEITAFQSPSFTTVYTAATYTPTAGINVHNFSTPFAWDGTSSIIVDICFANGTTNAAANQHQTKYTATSFTSSVYFNQDGTSTPCTSTTVSGSTPNRPNMRFGGQVATNVNSSLEWQWNPGGLDGATVTTTVENLTTANEVQTFTVTATNPSTGCSSTATVNVTVNYKPSAPTVDNPTYTQCGTQVPTGASVSSTDGAASPVFVWYDRASGGTPLQSSALNYYNSTVATTTTFYVSELNGTCEGPRAAVEITVSEPDAVVAGASSSTICPNTAVNLGAVNTGSTNNYTQFEWTASPAAGSGIATSMSGQNISVTPTAPGTYTYTVTATDLSAGCATTATVSVTVNPVPTITTATGPTAVCSEGSVALAATYVAPGAGVDTVGTANATALSTTGVPYRTGTTVNNEVRNQWLITPAEMTAAGFSAGNITSISFFVTTAAPTGTMSNMVWKMANVPQTNLTTTLLTPSFTTVLTQATYSPVTGMNTHTFSTPFVWDGTSSILVEQCAKLTTGGSGVTVQTTTTSGTTTVQASSATGCTAATGTVATGRPVIRFGGQVLTVQNGTYNWTWNPGNLSGASVTATAPTNLTGAPVTQVYTVTATNPTTGCSSSQNVSVTVNPAPVAPTASNSTQCGFGVPTASVAGAGGTYKWYSAATGGTLLQTGGTTYTTAISTTTTFYVSETGSNGCEGPRVAVTADVTQPDAVTASVNNATICLGASVNLSVAQTGSTNTYAYSWTSTAGSGITGSMSGTPITVTPTAAGTYTYMVTATDASAGCNASSSVSVTVNGNPAITAASGPTAVCSGASIALTAASIPASAATTTIGAGASLSSGFQSPFNHTWGGMKSQYLIRASELSAMNLQAGPITSLALDMGTGGTTYNGFAVSLGATPLTALTSTFVGGLTTVYSNAAQAITASTINTITFSTPFNWDGTSNIVVQICWSNNNSSGTSTTVRTDATAYVATSYYRVDNTLPAAVCAQGTATGTFSVRPKMILGGQVGSNLTSTYTWTWNPGSLTGASVTATAPANNTGSPFMVAYTVRATNATTGCFSEQTVNVTVNAAPSAPTAIGSTQCAPGVPTASVASTSGAATPSFKWYTVATGGTAVQTSTSTTYTSSVSSTTTFYVAEVSSQGCESARTAVTVTVNTPPAITLTANPTAICGGGMSTLSVSSANANYTYAWTPAAPLYTDAAGTTPYVSGSNATTVYAMLTESTTFTVTATDATSGCTTSASQLVTLSPSSPTVPTITPASATVCNAIAQSLTASSSISLPTSILTQNFNGANNWTTANASTGGTPANAAWTLRANNYNYNGTTFRSNDNSQFYMSNSEAQGNGGSTSTTLTSPSFSTEGYSAATVNFHQYFVFNSGDAARVEASTDGTNWTTLQTYSSTQGAPTVFSSASVNLTSAFLNKPDVYVRFRYTANFGSYWALDNVAINGTAAPLSYVWTPSTGLYTNAAATIPYTGGSAATVYAKIDAPQTYTVTASNISGCSSSNTVSLQVTISSVAPTSLNSSASLVCSGTDVVLTQTGGSLGDGAYWQWYSDASYGTSFKVGGPLMTANAQLTVSPAATTTYYLRAEGGTAPCAANVSGAATVTVSIYAPAAGGVASSDQTITAGTAPAALNVSDHSGTIARWTSASDAG
ncbi:PKD domain-containing protein, partial [Flaviaesturariibacter amylovorans]|uniref:Ig-like domain-containing protein n=1 Tax=Flaviaesturariibacter amylovorans TaxID=1084520 RepID=UPI0031EE355B